MDDVLCIDCARAYAAQETAALQADVERLTKELSTEQTMRAAAWKKLNAQEDNALNDTASLVIEHVALQQRVEELQERWDVEVRTSQEYRHERDVLYAQLRPKPDGGHSETMTWQEWAEIFRKERDALQRRVGKLEEALQFIIAVNWPPGYCLDGAAEMKRLAEAALRGGEAG